MVDKDFDLRAFWMVTATYNLSIFLKKNFLRDQATLLDLFLKTLQVFEMSSLYFSLNFSSPQPPLSMILVCHNGVPECCSGLFPKQGEVDNMELMGTLYRG